MTRKIEVFPDVAITDNSDASATCSVEWAINQLGTNGGEVLCHAGIYPMTNSLLIDWDWITVEGTTLPYWSNYGSFAPGNPGGCQFQWATAVNGITIGTTTANMHGDNRHKGIKIDQIDIEGSNIGLVGVSGGGSVDDMFVTKNIFLGWQTWAISDGWDYHHIEDNTIQGMNGGGVNDIGYYGTISGNIVYDDGGTDINVNGFTGFIVTDNQVGGSAAPSIVLGPGQEGTARGLVAHNTVENAPPISIIGGNWEVKDNEGPALPSWTILGDCPQYDNIGGDTTDSLLPCGNTFKYYSNSFFGTNSFTPADPSHVAILLTGSSGAIIPTFVQGTATTGAVIAAPGSVTSGNLLVYACSAGVISVGVPTDTLGNTWSILISTPTVYVATSMGTHTGADTITNPSGGPEPCDGATVQMAEYTNTTGLDGTATTFHSGGLAGSPTYASTPPLTTTTPNDLLVGFVSHGSVSSHFPFASVFSTGSGTQAISPAVAVGSYITTWAYPYATAGDLVLFALKPVAGSGQTADLEQDLSAPGGTLFGGRNKLGMSYFVPIAISALPSCVSGTAGTDAKVNNALAPVIGSTVASGGSAYAAVTCNGANWTVTGK
ncbi:MAG: hypothetical protein WAN35_19765 [Terracidiphilus sp.]